MRIALSVVSASLLAAAGCGASSGLEQDELAGTPEDPVPATSGPYQVESRIDFTVEAILPPQLHEIVVTLRDFSTNPARALFDLAERRGVPAVGVIRAALPAVLEDKLEGWINAEIARFEIAGVPITTYAGQIAELAELALTRFAIESELDLAGAPATHRLTALDLAPAGLDVRIPIGGFVGDLLTQTPDLAVGQGGALSLGEQHFGLNYGEYAWQGIEAASTQLFGQGVRASLGAAVDCPRLASAISDKCVLGVCVGHRAELTAICDGGLDAVVDLAHGKLADLRLEALHLANGEARLVDDDLDGIGDRIVDGVWRAELNLGLRHAPATFTGAR
ncbi:MAG: hypothetical protein ACTHU0_01480 [Kofleriaceae bacterium]